MSNTNERRKAATTTYLLHIGRLALLHVGANRSQVRLESMENVVAASNTTHRNSIREKVRAVDDRVVVRKSVVLWKEAHTHAASVSNLKFLFKSECLMFVGFVLFSFRCFFFFWA